jgi:hypothetical protein
VRRVLTDVAAGDGCATGITFEHFYNLFERADEEVKLHATISQWD